MPYQDYSWSDSFKIICSSREIEVDGQLPIYLNRKITAECATPLSLTLTHFLSCYGPFIAKPK